MPQFSLADGLAVQDCQMKRWAQILRPSTFKVLQERVIEANGNLNDTHDGHDVLRGDSLHALITEIDPHAFI